MRPLYKTRSLAACLLCFAAAATAQQTQGTAAVTASPDSSASPGPSILP